ncbi:MAG TPA: signal peptidase I [Elusimicrobiota bacterium]|nr:signal peptidase I [Elusimicrobiota bacterium]
MEGRLFFIGLAMGAYAWASRRLEKSESLDTPNKIGLWHALFCALAAFSAVLVLMVSMQDRARFAAPSGLLSSSEFYFSLAAAAAAALLGFWRGRRAGNKADTQDYYLAEDLEWSETVFSAVLLAAVLMYFVLQAFKIPSGSMENTLLIGDHLFVNKFIYGFQIPFTDKRALALRSVKQGDVIVFRFPDENPDAQHCGSSQYGKDFIKRVVGVPGDVVAVKDGVLYVDGQKQPTPPEAKYVDGPNRQPESLLAKSLSGKQYQTLWQTHRLDAVLQDVQRDYFGPVTVPPGDYFAMGDNRDRSCDSRYWGPVERKDIRGKAWFIYWPPSRVGLIH